MDSQQILIKIQVDASDRLLQAIEALTAAIGGRHAEPAPAIEEAQPAATVDPIAATEPAPMPEAKAEPAPAATAEAPVAVCDQPGFDSARIIKEAIHHKRVEYEGANYTEDRDSAGYATYHAAITRACRRIASQLSGGKCDKPTLLPAGLTQNFLTMLAEVKFDKQGKELPVKPPF